MKNILIPFFILFVCSSWAQSNIKVGEKAPEIVISEWIKNEPADKNLAGKFIVLEFWATWCGPCIAAVPHMNEVQKEYKKDDLYFISLTDESVEKVERTLKRIDFHSIVATDLTKKTFVEFGNGKDGLDTYPLTVLIDNKGIIQWIGEPKNLDSAVMDNFLNKTKTEIPVALENTTGNNDGKHISFSKLLSDTSIQNHYLLSETEPAVTMKLALGNTLFDLKSYTLKGIFAEVLKINDIEIPEKFNNKHFNLTYKTTEDSNALEDLEEKILSQLNLIKTSVKKPIKINNVYVADSEKLEPTLEEKFSSKSDAGDKIIFTANTIETMLEELSKIHSSTYVFKSEDNKKYDFIIGIKSKEDTINSLKSYGLKVQEIESEQDYYVLEEK